MLGHSPLLKEARAKAQGRKWSKGHGGMLLTSFLSIVPQPVFSYSKGPPVLEWHHRLFLILSHSTKTHYQTPYLTLKPLFFTQYMPFPTSMSQSSSWSRNISYILSSFHSIELHLGSINLPQESMKAQAGFCFCFCFFFFNDRDTVCKKVNKLNK